MIFAQSVQKKQMKIKKCLDAGGSISIPLLMVFCAPCSAVLAENPISALMRIDEYGNHVLCAPCRRHIYCANDRGKIGDLSFAYTNPNMCQEEGETPKPGVPIGAKQPTQDYAHAPAPRQWLCPQCSSRIWATPRVYTGDCEPHDWWWCRTCQREKHDKAKIENDKQRTEIQKKRKRDKSAAEKEALKKQLPRNAQSLHRWFGV